MVPNDRSVVGHAPNDSIRNPTHAVFPFAHVALGAPAQLNVEHDFGSRDFPGVSEPQPFVRQLRLPAVTNGLGEDPEFVPNPIAKTWNAQGGQRIEETGSQTAQSAVAQAWFFFLLQQHIQ